MTCPSPKKVIEKYTYIPAPTTSKIEKDEFKDPMIKEVSTYIQKVKKDFNKLTEYHQRKMLSVFSQNGIIDAATSMLPAIR